VTVCAVDAIHLGPLDAGVLQLDRAYALASVGDSEIRREYSYAVAVPDRLVDEIEAADYSGPFVDRLIDVVSFISHHEDAGSGAERIVDRLVGRSRQSAEFWEIDIALISEPEIAMTLGGSELVATYLSDLRTLPARLLIFSGPESAEVVMRIRGADTVELTANLRAQADASDVVENGVFAVAADPVNGDLLGFAQAEIRADQLYATMTLASADVSELFYTFITSDVDLSTLRLDRKGVGLTRIDRYCRHAWTQHRMAGAMRASLGLGVESGEFSQVMEAADTLQREAVEAMRTARSLVNRWIRRESAGDQRAALERYRGGVDELRAFIDSPPPLEGPTGPTLAEIHNVVLG
jgi:hypothetical protein